MATKSRSTSNSVGREQAHTSANGKYVRRDASASRFNENGGVGRELSQDVKRKAKSPSADELGQRAWQKTYENRRKG
ncbi:MAG TPA: hypothetical protein VF553_14430 [Pyrinomonadaceae bacterium]|jgi:hypothetical protein